MKTKALRLYGPNDLRLEEFDLPEPNDDQILATVETNSICMSCYKLAIQGAEHKRVPHDISKDPVIVGHEFCGTLLKVGKNYSDKFNVGSKYSVQPALNLPGREYEAPGYSFTTIGGHATKILIPAEVLQQDCLLPFDGDGFFKASLSEPVSCIIGAFNTQYHFKPGSYVHEMGIVEGGSTVILAGAGPMGLGAIDYALNGKRKPGLLVITDIDDNRLNRAASIFSPEAAKKLGVTLKYVNTGTGNPVQNLLDINGGKGYDDVFVFAPVAPLIEQSSAIAGLNACINFFAGPSKSDFKASINFYDVHYSGHHVVGSSGGNTDDMREALLLMESDKINPAVMITHVGGLDSAAETTLNLPKIPGGKKLVYTNLSMPMTALDDMKEIGKNDEFFAGLAEIVEEANGLWSIKAEEYVLKNGKKI